MSDDAANPEKPYDPRELRIGFDERDGVIEILRNAAGEGRITTDELDERIDRAAAARTYLDLDPIVADLPVPRPSDAVLPSQAKGPRPRRPGQEPDDPLILNASWDSDSRTGDWPTVPYIRLKTTAATAKLDFTRARNALSEIFVDVAGVAGTAVIVVPDGWGVDIDDLVAGWGSKRNKVDRLPVAGAPLITVTGTIGLGTFVARYPNYFERKKLEKN